MAVPIILTVGNNEDRASIRFSQGWRPKPNTTSLSGLVVLVRLKLVDSKRLWVVDSARLQQRCAKLCTPLFYGSNNGASFLQKVSTIVSLTSQRFIMSSILFELSQQYLFHTSQSALYRGILGFPNLQHLLGQISLSYLQIGF